MKITCFFMVCAYLSSTVSAEEIKHLNRIKKVKSWEELVPKDDTTRKESNPLIESYADVILQKFSPQVNVETFQKPKKNLPKIKFEPLQQQYYNRDHTKRPVRLKTRSVAGTSVINELSDELISNSIFDVHHDHDHKSIHIEPVFRVSKKNNNVFESIIDILRQLLDPPKNELGPLVGPVQVSGSRRKIYLRLLEPVDESHVMVRFVTQVPVPVIDAEAKHPVFSGPPVVDPATVFLHHHFGPSDAAFGSSNRHHHSIHPPRFNASLARGKVRGSQSIKDIIKHPSKDPSKDLQDSKVAGDSSPNKEETSKGIQNNQLPGGSPYHFETEEEALKQVNAILDGVNATTINEAQEHQLTTHRLPLRQIAPLYSLTSMTHNDPNADTYKVPSDVLTGPSSYSSSYEQYGDPNSAPDFYASSYDQHYSAPSSYATSYNQQSNVHSTPTTYNTINYQTQNEFNPHSISYQHQDEFSPHTTSYDKHNDLYSSSSSHSTSYERPASIPPLSSTHATFHKKPNGAPITSASHATPHEKQNQGAQSGSNSGDALHIIDPPYFSGYPKFFENHVNRSLDPAAIHQPRYNLHGLNNNAGFAHGAESLPEKIIWGKSRQQKSDSEFQKNLSENSSEKGGHDKWQPVVFVHENAGWHEAFKADLAKTTKQPSSSSSSSSSDRSRKISRNTSTSSLEKGTVEKRQSGKRRGSTLRSSWCMTDKEDGCEETKFTMDPASETTVVHLKKTIQIAEKTQARPTVDIKSIPAIVSNSTASFNTTETSDITSKSPTTSSTTSSPTTTKLSSSLLTDTSPVASGMIEQSLPSVQTTKRPEVNGIGTTTKPPLLIDTSNLANSMIEKPLPLVQTTRRPDVNNVAVTTKLPPLLIDTSLLASKIMEKPLPLVQTTRRSKMNNVDATTKPSLLIDTSNLANSMIEKPLPLVQTTRKPEVNNVAVTTKLPPLLIDTSLLASKIMEKPLPLVQTTRRPEMNNVDATTKPSLLIDTSNLANNMIEKPLPSVQTTRKPEPSSTGTTKKLIANETTKNKFVIKIEDNSRSKLAKQPSSSASSTPRKPELPKRPMIMKKPMFIMKRIELNSAPKKSIASSTTQNPTTSSTTSTRTMKFSKFRSTHFRKPSTT